MNECPSCGSEAVGRYCPECGQQQGPLLPTLRSWLRDALDELLLVDARLPRTLRLLFFRLGHLSQEWSEGRRSQYVAPLRLYLLSAAFLFFVWPLSAERQGAYFEDFSDDLFGELYDERMPADVEEWQSQLASRIVSAMRILLLVVSVPLLAVINRGPWAKNADSLVLQTTFSLHFHAVALFVIALSICLGAVWSVLQSPGPLLIVLIALMAASLRGAFGTTWRASIARSLALYLAFGFSAAVVAFAHAGITLLLWR